MKTNYKFYYVYVLMLFLGFLMTGCDEDQEDEKSEWHDVANDQMYFPATGTDEWESRTPEELSWDTTNLNEALRYAKEKGSFNVLVLYKGRIVVEKYWRKTDATSQHDLNSVAKSITAFVIGVLQQDGTLHVDDTVSNYLTAGWSRSPDTEAKITVRHLLTMTSGLNDSLQYVGPPGETWRYSHMVYQVLYDVIEAATGKSYREVFDSIIFSKTGMTNFSWSGKDLMSPARQLGRFGLMILNKGVWNGEKLINDEGYFSAMLTPSQALQPAYGYLWWLNGTETWYDAYTRSIVTGPIAPNLPSDAWLAKGKHDQRIYIVPSLDMVVIRQGVYNGLPEMGEGSFDAEFWKRLMSAINHGELVK